MLKFLRNKIQSLTETQLNLLTAVLVLINIGIVIFWINFWISSPKITPPEIEEKPTSVVPPFEPGEIGELTEKEVEEKKALPLPQMIFNTSGTISEVKKDRLIVQGSGSNFSDQKTRELTLIFTESTTTFPPGQKVMYEGFGGLKYLKAGDSIVISSPENIRGKTQFIVDYVNKI